mmetsp:Transcript_125489/g.363074  ORF Transcript_125489/g.363074 Transcript_125489/m.363074 type:complete len:306 (+) Transcript_125489:59-976(+)
MAAVTAGVTSALHTMRAAIDGERFGCRGVAGTLRSPHAKPTRCGVMWYGDMVDEEIGAMLWAQSPKALWQGPKLKEEEGREDHQEPEPKRGHAHEPEPELTPVGTPRDRQQQQQQQTDAKGEKAPEERAGEEAKAPPQTDAGEHAVVSDEPSPEEDDMVVFGLACYLEQLVEAAPESCTRTCFHAPRPPPIAIAQYIGRLRNMLQCSNECFVLAMVYIDRLIKQHSEVSVNPLTCHRLVASSLTVAAKFHDDVFHTNEYYAKVCGISLKEMNSLERGLLELLCYDLLVQTEEFHAYRHTLCQAGQ